MKLVILGKPGSGKGTQAQMISKELGIPAVSMGEILRQIEKQDTTLGRKIKKVIDKGQLLPAKMALDILDEKLRKLNMKKGVILDGFPRTISQAKALEKKMKIDKAIYLDVPDKLIVKRLSSRRECYCGTVYNMTTNPPKRDEICDRCGRRLYRRKDDEPATIKKRLGIYNKLTKPVIDFYRKKKMLLKVDGAREIKSIFNDIIKKTSA